MKHRVGGAALLWTVYLPALGTGPHSPSTLDLSQLPCTGSPLPLCPRSLRNHTLDLSPLSSGSPLPPVHQISPLPCALDLPSTLCVRFPPHQTMVSLTPALDLSLLGLPSLLCTRSSLPPAYWVSPCHALNLPSPTYARSPLPAGSPLPHV